MVFITGMLFFISNLTIANNHNSTIPIMNKTAKPGEFLHTWMQHNSLSNVLILLDLDDTVLQVSNNQQLGHSEMFYHLCAEQKRKHPGMTIKEAAGRVDPLLTQVYFYQPFKLTDNRLPAVINQLKEKGAVVLGFTSRGQPLKQVTGRQLKQTGIAFTRRFDGKTIMPDNSPVYIDNGVIFAGQHCKKGDTLARLLTTNKLNKPETILLIDDRKSHLENCAEALLQYKNIQFIPVLCTYPQEYPFVYDDKKAKNQLLDFLYTQHNKKQIAALLRSDPFTRELITTECNKITDKNSKICKTLLADIRN
ncbi:MAG: DUF2608 domain-containing protein [Endozoicomonadaceae bacterium]|nr:DUF2608 domain-containing protein [Endozoicomonadaceae bacterium]